VRPFLYSQINKTTVIRSCFTGQVCYILPLITPTAGKVTTYYAGGSHIIQRYRSCWF